MPVTMVAAPAVIYDLSVPPPVAAPVAKLKSTPEIRPGEKRIAKKSKIQKSILSRTARTQIALAAAKPKAGTTLPAESFDNDDADTGTDELDLHRSFSRPRVVQTSDQDDDDNSPEITDPVKLRLFLARMKAVEAHKVAWAADQADSEDLHVSDAVKLRLFLARMRALEAHQKKFS